MSRTVFSAGLGVVVASIAAVQIGYPAEPAANIGPETQAVAVERAILPADVRRHIDYLASPELEGRSGKGSQKAAAYVCNHLKGCGLAPLFPEDSYFQDIPGTADENGMATTIGSNVGALLVGSDPGLQKELVILSAHYDHLGVRNGELYAGADDNASGVAMLLEVARQISSQAVRPKRSIAFVSFDLEERMLWGSRWFVAHPPRPLEQIKFFMTADMIGRSLGDLPLPTVFVLGSEHAPALKGILNGIKPSKELEVCRLGIDLVGTRSDYGPFRDRKIPFLFFSTGQHPDYHTPRDLPERIDNEKVANVSELVLQICTETANRPEAPVWTDAIESDLDEPAALNRIATLLLKAEKERPLNSVQRMLISHAKNKTQQIIDRGTMTASERTWLIRVSQVMLFSVF